MSARGYACGLLIVLANAVVVVLVFFCFKQKTAYEMRISDWSSDVCSSDLELGHRVALLHGFRCRDDSLGTAARAVRRDQDSEIKARPAPEGGADRKSVVEGTSVSVRVDLGGRRIIKKKTNRPRQIVTDTLIITLAIIRQQKTKTTKE